MTRSRVVNFLGIAIGLAGLAFVALRISRDRAEIADALDSADPIWLAAAFGCGLASMSLLGANWLAIIRHSGPPAPWRRGLYWFFVGQLGKYVPGGIWPVVGQAELTHRDGTPRPIAYGSTALSMVATLLGAMAVAALAGTVSPAGSRLVPILFAVGLAIGLTALACRPLRDAVHRLVARLGTGVVGTLRLPDARWFATTVARYLPAWLIFAGINIFSVVALGGTVDAELAVSLIYATTVSWIAGFVVIGLPGGLGVREAVFISMMTAPLGAGLAVSVAVVSRIVSVAVDLFGAAVSAPVARSAPPLGEADSATGYAAP